jgi:hypothetical protein
MLFTPFENFETDAFLNDPTIASLTWHHSSISLILKLLITNILGILSYNYFMQLYKSSPFIGPGKKIGMTFKELKNIHYISIVNAAYFNLVILE